MERDRQVTKALEDDGWLVLRFWEWQIKKQLDDCVNVVMDAVHHRTIQSSKGDC